MSKLGNIELSYGKQFNIAIANTYSNIVLSGSNLPVNTIIISSNINEELDDTGSYSMIVTDNEGTPVRLTYCIKQGNGLVTDNTNEDILILKIDDTTIKNNQSGIHIDLSNIKNGNIYSKDNILYVNNNSLNVASDVNRGIFAIDGKTILLDDLLYINTDNLEYSDNITNTYGIIGTSDEIVNINNGIISIDETNIPKADKDTFGICKCDGNTTFIEDNIIHVNTENLGKANEDEFGIISIDNDKIKSNSGILSVETTNLAKSSEINKGILGIDGTSITLNSNDQISVKDYTIIMEKLNNLVNDADDKLTAADDIKNYILSKIK